MAKITQKILILLLILLISVASLPNKTLALLDFLFKPNASLYTQTPIITNSLFPLAEAVDLNNKNLYFGTISDNYLIEITNPIALNSIFLKTATPRETYLVVATAYSSTIDQTDSTPFITASGTYVRDGIIATNFLPFGTIIKMPELFGNKTFIVEDRMNRRYGLGRIDIWFPKREIAKEFGAKQILIEVL